MRLRADAATAVGASGLIVRHGAEETVVVEGAHGLEEARLELQGRGLWVTGAPEGDWRRVLGVPDGRTVALAHGPEEFRHALEAHGLLGSNETSSLALFIEHGVDIQARQAFNRDSLRRGRAWLWMQVPGFNEIRWCTFAPGESACAECMEARLMGNRRNAHEYRAVLGANGGRLPTAVMPAVLSTAAGLALLECARLLSEGPAASIGRVSSFDLQRFVFESERLLPVPGCEACAC